MVAAGALVSTSSLSMQWLPVTGVARPADRAMRCYSSVTTLVASLMADDGLKVAVSNAAVSTDSPPSACRLAIRQVRVGETGSPLAEGDGYL